MERPTTRTLNWVLPVPVLLWALIFWWQPLPFWDLMAPSMLILMILALRLRARAFFSERLRLVDVAIGVGSAAVLYGLFYLGNAIAPLILPGATSDIGGVYGMTSGVSPALIGVLLLLIVGPAEALFWQGTVQTVWMRRFGKTRGWLLTGALYGGIHLFSFNPMLVVAALVAGLSWGLLYRQQHRVWQIVISHALWDLAVLVLWPIH